MDKKSQIPRYYIKGKPISKEALYYSILFGIGGIIGLVILIIALANKNSNLTLYSGIITVMFLLASLAAATYILIRREAIYLRENKLVIAKLFSTKRFAITNIEKLTAATNNQNGVTSINVTCLGKVAHYKFKNISKEEIARLRRAVNG